MPNSPLHSRKRKKECNKLLQRIEKIGEYIRYEQPIKSGARVVILIPDNIEEDELIGIEKYLETIKSILYG